MAATVTTDFYNLGTGADAESVTNWTVYRISGSGSGPTAALEPDVSIQGSNSISCTTNKSRNWLYFDVATAYGTALDFTASTGAEDGQNIYIWWNFSTPGFAPTRNGGGITICLGHDDGNYIQFYIEGSDTYAGGWQRAVIDPTTAWANGVQTGSPSISNIGRIGMVMDVQGSTARFTNTFIDRIDVGTGLTVYGTSTAKVSGDNTTGVWADVVAADEGDTSNKYGIVTTRSDIIYVNGSITLGDGASTNASVLDDEDRIIVWENPTFNDGGGSGGIDYSLVDDTWAKLTLVGNTTGNTTIVHGNKIGTGDTASGSNGCEFISAGPSLTIDVSDGDLDRNSSNYSQFYGCKFFKVAGGITLNPNLDASKSHEFIGNTIDQCAQINVDATVIRGCTFSGTTSVADTEGSILWNENIDIKNCNFLANTASGTGSGNDPSGIEHPSAAGSPYDYTGLVFSGNDFDVTNTSGSSITINADSNTVVGTYNTRQNSVTISNTKTVTVTISDKNGGGIENAMVAIQKITPDSYISSTGNTAGSATFVITTTIAADTPAGGWVRIKDVSSGKEQAYRYTSWATSTFTFLSEATGTCDAAGTTTQLLDTGADFGTTIDVEIGDTIRNTTSGAWATVKAITSANELETTVLSSGSWADTNTWSIHRLGVTYVNGTDTAKVPLLNEATDGSGQVSLSYNYGGDKDIRIKVRKSTSGTKYYPTSSSGTIKTTGFTTTITMTEDTTA